MSDLISRDEAVATVLGTSIEYQLIYGKKEPKEGFVRSLIKRIANIPPQEEPEWIPVSEKPITPGLYIVTLKDGKGLFTDTAEWNPTFGGRWQCVFYDDDAIGEYRDISNVVAWMPLPKPYQEEEHE